MTQSLIEAVERFTDPCDESQLRQLDELLCSSDTQRIGSEEFRALLGIFERFPEDDGFDVFWGILHFLESCDGYESDLVTSVLRKPVEFNVLMINRLLNGGIVDVNGQSLLSVLASVALNPAATSHAKGSAQQFISYQRLQGRAEA
jgi:hypothetical protein